MKQLIGQGLADAMAKKKAALEADYKQWNGFGSKLPPPFKAIVDIGKAAAEIIGTANIYNQLDETARYRLKKRLGK